MNKTERILKELSELCEQAGVMGATINYSVHSEKFYLHFPLNIKENDVISRGICEHRDTMEEAAIAAVEALRGKILVSRADGEIKNIYFYLSEEAHNGQST